MYVYLATRKAADGYDHFVRSDLGVAERGILMMIAEVVLLKIENWLPVIFSSKKSGNLRSSSPAIDTSTLRIHEGYD